MRAPSWDPRMKDGLVGLKEPLIDPSLGPNIEFQFLRVLLEVVDDTISRCMKLRPHAESGNVKLYPSIIPIWYMDHEPLQGSFSPEGRNGI